MNEITSPTHLFERPNSSDYVNSNRAPYRAVLFCAWVKLERTYCNGKGGTVNSCSF
jgi:hypothetical protein